MNIKGSTLLITGGASGIGRIMGRLALQQGAEAVAIWDINEQHIEETVAAHRYHHLHDAMQQTI